MFYLPPHFPSSWSIRFTVSVTTPLFTHAHALITHHSLTHSPTVQYSKQYSRRFLTRETRTAALQLNISHFHPSTLTSTHSFPPPPPPPPLSLAPVIHKCICIHTHKRYGTVPCVSLLYVLYSCNNGLPASIAVGGDGGGEAKAADWQHTAYTPPRRRRHLLLILLLCVCVCIAVAVVTARINQPLTHQLYTLKNIKIKNFISIFFVYDRDYATAAQEEAEYSI